MTKIICSLFMIALLTSTKVMACVCSPQTVSDYFQQSQFVAKARILKVTPDSANNDYHDADIELITLYKGERRAKIKILSVRNSSCFFLPSVNSTWIIFASVSQGTLAFGSCSGSLELDRVFNTAQYPNAGKNYSKEIALKQQVLEYLSRHGILNPNPPGLYFFSDNLRLIKGHKNTNRFAVFQVDVNADLSVSNIRVLKRFKNNALNTAVLNSMKMDLKFVKRRRDPITKSFQLIIFCYFYEYEDQRMNSVSFFSL